MWPNDALWQRLEAFELDVEGASLPFSARLARDNSWSPGFAARVALEYKKFLYLACNAGHVVVPSEEVDQAWHLHLTYTRSYWDELCARVLQQPLHHDPTRGGKNEGQKHASLYERTLDSYRATFGTAPPSDIWPPTLIRFGEAAHFRRVNLKRHWVIPRPQLPRVNRAVKLKVVPAVLLVLVLAGCSRSGSLDPFDWYGDEFLKLFAVLCFALIPFSLWKRVEMAAPSDENLPATPLDSYLLARLADSGALPVDAALTSLQNQDLIQIDRGLHIERTGITAPTHPFENEVWNAIHAHSTLPEVRERLQGALQRFDAQLQQLGLLVSDDTRAGAQRWPIFTALGLAAFGFIKILVGLSRQRPVGFLTIACLALLAFAIAMSCGFALRQSRRGEFYLQKLRRDHSDLRSVAGDGMAGSAFVGAEVVLMMALWGYAPLPPDLRTIYQPQGGGDGGSSSGGDGGGGCGGGGDGGGGGGCGGCGGGCGGCGGG